VKIVSGGQTGADRGALDAAIELGIEHGGFCPRGRLAEDGTIPERYRLTETATEEYSERTEKNVLAAQATVVFSHGEPTGGSLHTVAFARARSRVVLVVDLDATSETEAARLLRETVRSNSVSVLNIAGSRESKSPGIFAAVRRVVLLAFTAGV